MTIKKNHHCLPAILLVIMTALFLNFPAELHGQSKINSPYSMFGPGEVSGNEYHRNLALGGISQGFRSRTSVNYLNPASYTVTDSLSFIFEGTVFSHFYSQTLDDKRQTTNYSALGNINFSFPIIRGWNVALGLLPYSQVGYSISDFFEDDVTGRVNYIYEGSGGINKIYFGHGVRIYKGLSAGVNLAYLFGKNENMMMAHSDSSGFYRTAWSYNDDIDGFMITYGLQFELPIDPEKNRKLTLGASYTSKTDLDLQQNTLVLRDLPGVLPGIDTLNHIKGDKGKMTLPASFAAGAFMTFNNRWSAGLDFHTQNWSSFESFNHLHNLDGTSSLNDSYQIRAGAIFNPRIETYSTFLSRWEYRFGARYGQSFLKVYDQTSQSGHEFMEFGISFGLGIPVRRSLTALNLGFEYSQRSTGQEGLISDSFYKINIGINIYERWFMRSRFF